MGIGMFGSSSFSSYDKRGTDLKVVRVEQRVEVPVELPNPDPFNYIIGRKEAVGRFLIIEITYPDCTNYEGKKILMYEYTTIEDLKEQKSIDPHFSTNKRFYSPIARFEPTELGWGMALTLANSLEDDE